MTGDCHCLVRKTAAQLQINQATKILAATLFLSVLFLNRQFDLREISWKTRFGNAKNPLEKFGKHGPGKGTKQC